MGTRRITDIISQSEIETWHVNDNILITAPTDSGKSYFIKNTLYDYCKQTNKKILYLLPRVDTINQFEQELVSQNKTDIIEIESYQHFENFNVLSAGYDFIVADEANYFFADSDFNAKTDISFKQIMQSQSCRIFLTATSGRLIKYMEQHNQHIKTYTISGGSNADKISFFQEDMDVAEMLQFASEYGNKMVVFINDVKRAYSLYKQHEKISMFNCSKYNRKFKQYRSEKEMQELALTGKLPKQILISTSAMDTGFNIVDPEVHNIIVDGISDVDTIIQCIGRKRKTREHDSLYVYVREYDNKFLRGKLYGLNGQLKISKHFKEHTLAEHMQAYNRISDQSNIIYDYLDENGNIKKAVNEIKFFNVQYEIAEIKSMMENEKHSFCDYVTNCLGLNQWSYYDNEQDERVRLEKYLASIEGKIFYTKDEKRPLAETIGIHRKYKLLKTANVINPELSNMGIKYKIKEYDTRRNGKKVKNAWKIVRNEELI